MLRDGIVVQLWSKYMIASAKTPPWAIVRRTDGVTADAGRRYLRRDDTGTFAENNFLD